MPDDRIVRCRNWMRKIIDAPNVDGWQNMVDTPDDDFTDPDFADKVDKDDFDNRYPEYVKKVMLEEEEYQGKEISDAEYEEYVERMSKNFKYIEKKEKEPEAKTLKEKESYEERQERYFKGFEAMQKKHPYLTDTEISEKLRAEKDNNDLSDAIKDYERMHGKNSFYVQIDRIYNLIENGIEFDTAFKKCKFPYSYKKHVMKALQELKRYESITKT